MFKIKPKHLNEEIEIFLREDFRKGSFCRENKQKPVLKYIKKILS